MIAPQHTRRTFRKFCTALVFNWTEVVFLDVLFLIRKAVAHLAAVWTVE